MSSRILYLETPVEKQFYRTLGRAVFTFLRSQGRIGDAVFAERLAAVSDKGRPQFQFPPADDNAIEAQQ